MKSLFPPVLFSSGKLLLLASGSISISLAIYRNEGIEKPFVRLAGMTMLLFCFSECINTLFSLTNELTLFFEQLGSRDGLKDLIVDALQRSRVVPNPNGSNTKFNIPAVIEQLWRTGVWGVVSVLAECFFLLSSLLLEIGREITLQMIWILYPLLVGVGPLFPTVTYQFLMHILCVSLWWPLFTLVTVVTGVIARHYMAHTNSWGLTILALELIACLMTCAIPMIAHRLVNGSISQTNQQLSVKNFQNSVTTNLKKIGSGE